MADVIDRLAYTMSEAAEALGVSLWVIKKEMYEGRIVGVKFGTRVVIPRWSLEQRLRAPEAGGALADAQKAEKS